MATVQIEGTVSGTFKSGIRVTEKDGEHEKRWTVWTSERPAEGAAVIVTGTHRDKVGEYNGRTYVERSVNDATIQAPTAGPTSPRAATAAPVAPEDPWGTATSPLYGADTPF